MAKSGKRGFSVAACAKKREEIPLKIPKAADVKIGQEGRMNFSVPFPEILLEDIGNPPLVIGFDVETHDWPDNEERKGRIGQFGWYTLKDEETLRKGHIVQIGWVIGRSDLDAPITSKARFVRPDGFEVSEKAEAYHHITQDKISSCGQSLTDVLQEFMCDVRDVYSQGGVAVAHQLESLGVLRRCAI